MSKKGHALVGHFEKAGLTLKVHDKPLRSGRGMERIFQIDVGRSLKGNHRREWFRAYFPPGQDVSAQVRGVDKKRQQLVLLVREGENTFEEEVPYRSWQAGTDFKSWVSTMRKERGIKVIKVNKPGTKNIRKSGSVIVERTTPSEIRYFLMGVDERQLFIAQLTNPATTVDAAHKLLGRTVQFFEGKRKGSKMDRQGEWFFLETSKTVRDDIDNRIRKNELVVRKKVAIGDYAGRSGGSPHTVDELVRLSSTPLEHGFPVRKDAVYVRGKVRHRDHKTVKFTNWREVIANNEGATASANASGVLWVD